MTKSQAVATIFNRAKPDDIYNIMEGTEIEFPSP